MITNPLIPTKAGTQAEVGISYGVQAGKAVWVPAFAGMTGDFGWVE